MFLSQIKTWIKGGREGRRERGKEEGTEGNEEREILQFLEKRIIVG